MNFVNAALIAGNYLVPMMEMEAGEMGRIQSVTETEVTIRVTSDANRSGKIETASRTHIENALNDVHFRCYTPAQVADWAWA